MDSQRKAYHFDAICLRRQLRKPVKEQNVFCMTRVPLVLRFEPMEYFYLKLRDAIAYSQ